MKIVCFGDSVTRGVTFVGGRLRILKSNYPSLLHKALSRFGQAEVINKGIFNDNSDLLVQRLDEDVIHLNPDYVLVEVGGNDCNFKWSEVAKSPYEQHDPIVPFSRYLDNLRDLVLSIRDANAIPILLNLLPLDPVRYYRQLSNIHGPEIAHWIARCGGIEHWHAMYNRGVSSIANALSVGLMDVRTAFKRAADLSILISDDGIHPTEQGYQVMTSAIFDEFQRFVEL
jgi:lysophospholipase L1-like esterase